MKAVHQRSAAIYRGISAFVTPTAHIVHAKWLTTVKISKIQVKYVRS